MLLYTRGIHKFIFFMISNLFWNRMQVHKCSNYVAFFKEKYIGVCNKSQVSMTVWFRGWLHVEFLTDVYAVYF